MSVVIVSGPPFAGGAQVAKRAAELLQYRLIERNRILEEAARTYHIPYDALSQALEDTSGWRSLPAKHRRVRLACIQASLAEDIVEGNCVCYGLSAHLYVTGLSHVLKVRLEYPVDERIATAARQEQISERKARKLVLRRDTRRRRWVKELFHFDEDAADSYDLVIDSAEVDQEQAGQRIADAARQRRFQPMTYSLKRARDFSLASRVLAQLVEIDPEVLVSAEDGVVHVQTKVFGKNKGKVAALEERARAVPQVESVEIDVIQDVFASAAVSMR